MGARPPDHFHWGLSVTLPPNTDVLFVSNGHGEDAIAAAILDELAPDEARRSRIVAWPQVGTGQRYTDRGIVTLGPQQDLPSEGFGTVSLGNFFKDLRAGFVGSYLRQARYARSLRGQAQLLVAIGDIVPLMAGGLSRMRTLFYSAPKSAHYGGYDGHTPIERVFMKRCDAIWTRDPLTADRLTRTGVRAQYLGNPMMDGLEGKSDPRLRPQDRTVAVLLAGSRADAVTNTATLLALLGAAKTPCHGLIAAHDGFESENLQRELPYGWSVENESFVHSGGATAILLKGRFRDALNAADVAVGMAGTANEQAVGLGIPLIALPGAGNQGAAFQRMKARYFGSSAINVENDPRVGAEAFDALASDPDRRARMAEAGRKLMGPPGGSAAIAKAIAFHAGWEAAQ